VWVAEQLNDDPIKAKSYSGALLISSLALMGTLAWALWQEFVLLRPWRDYQRRFVSVYEEYLKKELPKQKAAEEAIRGSAEYQKLAAEAKAVEEVARPQLAALGEQIDLIQNQIDALSPAFINARGKVTALIYQVEIASSPGARKNREEDVLEARREKARVRMPAEGGKTEVKEFDFDQLEAEFNRLKAMKAGLVTQRTELQRTVSDAARARDTYFQEKLDGLTPDQINASLRGARNLDVIIRQINVKEAGLVDRCQSCHIAMDPKIVPPNLRLTKAALGLEKSKDAPYSSHPNPELLRLHNIEQFGCSPCHGGNGRATNSVIKGHGRHKYWLWPLYYRENMEAGCQNCHTADMVTEMAPTLNQGRELFRQKGCIGCHRYEGFDNEGEQLLAARQAIRQMEMRKKEIELEIPRLDKAAGAAEDNATAQRLYAQINGLQITTAELDAKIEQLDARARSLMREEKKVGPSLKEVRMKLNRDWIPYWLEHTHEFRPTTKMPQFRLKPDEAKAISAFIWQMGVPGPTPRKQQPGNAPRGKELLETRGCLACHSIGEGERAIGGAFAANLSRVGEKANFDYLVRWIHNPRERTRPYDPVAKKDLGPEDYAKFGKPFVFDLENSRSPDGKHELQVQQPTVMPSLRLTVDDARDIATYLMNQKRANFTYAAAPYMDDASLRETGRALAKNYGCAGCHEIATLEEEGRIGTELTVEGSKPIERLDFALLTEHAKRGILPDGKPNVRDGEPGAKWYDHKGFFEQKLSNPAIFDQGKYVTQLKMPQPNVNAQEITALTTFLLGSVEQQLPVNYRYRPGDQRRDIQEGWWIISKYNCMGCHQVHIGQETVLQKLPMYQGENKDKLPPPLIGEGARVNPEWLRRFLTNPALSAADANKNGVRNYLAVRMPTFSFSDNEIRKLVRFFEAMSAQAQPYIPQRLEPLSETERSLARALFTHPDAPCLKCHATGQPAHDARATAPNFLFAPDRLRPAWTARWITEPGRLAPGTAMPSGLFRREGGRWVFAFRQPPALKDYPKDHAELLVRYMFQITPEEQRLLLGRTPSAASIPQSGTRPAQRAGAK
jgi:cytochrome c551/c552